MPAAIPTTCRLCESACGLLATVGGDGGVTLVPDPEHPVSKGYACRKGTRFGDIHGHPERVLRPRVRRGGAWAETGWDEALGEAGRRLRALRAAHGPESIGLYLGNAAGHSLGAILGAQVLQRAIGTKKAYSCLTLDNSGMFVVLEACLGDPMATFVADYAGADHIVLFGTDPLASQPSQAQSNPAGVGELLAARARLTVVDPRSSATARQAAHHLRPRPGSDLVLLAALVRAVLLRRPPATLAASDALLAEADVAALAAAVAPFDDTRAAAETGLPREAIAALAQRLLAAERPLVWSGLGVLLGPHGTLGYWLTLALQAVLGGLDRPGGWLRQRGAVDLAAVFRRIGPKGSDPALRSRIGGFPAVLGTLAAATLADDALTPGEGQLRALIVVGGNPAVSLPDTDRAARALASLDLLVTVDLFARETAAYAHVVLPAADWLERTDVQVHMASQRRIPHLQVAPAVVPPRGEAREDWAILTGLARAVGGPLGYLAGAVHPTTIAAAAVSALSPFSWAALRAAPRGLVAPGEAFGALRATGARCVNGGTVRLAVPAFVSALADVAGAPSEPAGLRLVTSVRPIGSLNTWIRGGAGPVATLHPEDLAALGSPAWIRITGPGGTVDVEARGDPALPRGTVVLPFGDARGNPNRVIGVARLDVFTGQPLSNGAPVTVEAAPAPGWP
ncbi:MAG: molybdopterin-dependent oxidoreductase [Pseudomonadota bacterium]|nr:molybdopterin-dependent oxidoreductase [Pseudomonadota bacterium]